MPRWRRPASGRRGLRDGQTADHPNQRVSGTHRSHQSRRHRRARHRLHGKADCSTKAPRSRTGDHLYQLERGPFQADLASKEAQVAQQQATLDNAKLTTERQRMACSPVPPASNRRYDTAVANQRQPRGAGAGRAGAGRPASQINLDYTDIRSPITGRIGRTSVTIGNVVSPSSGVLHHHRQPGSDVCHLPGVGARVAGPARSLCAPRAVSSAVVIRVSSCLTDGIYEKTGQLNFVNNTIAAEHRHHPAARHDSQSAALHRRHHRHRWRGARTFRR